MSYVTNVIIDVSYREDDGDARIATREINSFFEVGRGFRRIENSDCGGTKCLECNLLIGAFNHLSLDELRAHLVKIGVEVQLLVKDQGDDFWSQEIINEDTE